MGEKAHGDQALQTCCSRDRQQARGDIFALMRSKAKYVGA